LNSKTNKIKKVTRFFFQIDLAAVQPFLSYDGVVVVVVAVVSGIGSTASLEGLGVHRW
jgi:hypothetical protein